MADDYQANPGAGGAMFRADDDGTRKWPVFKLAYGADGEFVEVTDAVGKRVPITGPVSLSAEIPAGTQLIGSVKLSDGTLTASVRDTGASDSLNVAIVDASGNQITSFGGGTQYTEDAAAAGDPVGTMLMAVRADALAAVTTTDGDNIALRATNKGEVYVKHTDAIPVTDNGGSLTVDGSVTANAGTNLNTSLLALEAGGNLAAATTALQIMDDWDESDRAKVNPIVGQAGVQGGSGAVSALTQRVVLATDVALPAGTNAIGKLAANSGVDIGDVDVTSVPADPFGLNADAASATGSISAKLRFIASTGIPITGTVTVGAHAVTNAGTFAVQESGNALTALQLIDDPVVVMGTATYTEATSKGFAVSAVRRDADTPLADTTNEFSPLITDARGALKVEAFSGETLPVSLASLPALAAGTNNIGDVDVLTVPADPFGANADAASATGSISAKLRYLASAFKAEDSGHTTADIGAFVLAVRNDADAASAGSDLDYSFLSTDAGGNQNVRPRPDLVRQQITSAGLTTATTAYVAGDMLGNQFTFTNCARKSGAGGRIRGVIAHDETAVTGAMDLFVFDSSVTQAADNAANSWSDSDMQKLVHVINLVPVGSALNRVAVAMGLDIPYICSGSTSLFGGLVTRSGHTFFGATTSIKVTFIVEPN